VSAAALAGEGPGGRHSGGQRARPEATRGETLALGLMLAAGAVALSAIVLKEAVAVRDFEAWLSGHVVPLLTGIRAGSYVHSPVIWFAASPNHYLGLFITPDCTIDAVIVPFTVVTGWVMWRRVRLLRPLVGLAVAVALLFAVNQFRFILIVLLTVHFGYVNGFYWGHTLIGSLITVFGVVLVFVVYAFIAVRRKSSGPRQGEQLDHPRP
jgi:exosortase/archaeosortase family protein